jgi:hypothetical protein
VKDARAFEHALTVDPGAGGWPEPRSALLPGPGWLIGFGDDKKARRCWKRAEAERTASTELFW